MKEYYLRVFSFEKISRGVGGPRKKWEVALQELNSIGLQVVRSQTNVSSVWDLLPQFINGCPSLEELKEKTGLRVFFWK